MSDIGSSFPAQGAPWSIADTEKVRQLARQLIVTSADCRAAFPDRKPSAVRRKVRAVRNGEDSKDRDFGGSGDVDWKVDAAKGSAKLLAAIHKAFA